MLVIKHVVPYPPNQGTRVVTFELIRALRPEFDVTVLTRALDPEDDRAARDLEQWCERVVTVRPANRRSLLHRVAYRLWYSLVSLTTGRSMKSLYDCPGALVDAVRRLDPAAFDIVVVEYWQLYPLLDVIPREKTVLFTHDIDLLVNRARALMEKRLMRKLKLVRQWRTEQREEVRAYLAAPRILALTERDAHAARKLSRERADVRVLPFGVDADALAPPPGLERRREVLFMGALGAVFNRDALVYFAESIYPLLDGCDCDIAVVGGELPPEVAWLGRQQRVRVTGRVDDIRECLHRAGCIVVPLRFGGGLRIRIIEALMAGLPVVCSTVAIAGMDFEAGVHYLLADTPGETADAIRRVLDDPGLAASLSRAGRERAVERYGPGAPAATRTLFKSFLDNDL